MPTPETIALTDSADLRSYLTERLGTDFIGHSLFYFPDEYTVDVNFLDGGSAFTAGATVTLKSGPPMLKGIVMSVLSYGGLGTGGLIAINARQLAAYLRANP